MKVVTKSNFDLDNYNEVLVAENVHKYIGRELVTEWNVKYLDDRSDYYLKLVEDDYELQKEEY